MDIKAIFLGWLLGVLSPLIVQAIKDKKQSKSVRNGIIIELKEFKLRMLQLVYLFKLEYGTMDRTTLIWLNDQLESYSGVNYDEAIKNAISLMLNLNDEELKEHLLLKSNTSSKAHSVKTHQLPYIESKLNCLSLFSEKQQELILEILVQLRIFNETIDESRFYHKLTFDGNISTENHKIVCDSLTEKYIQLGNRSRIIAERISLFELS